ncbi:MAG: bifunctional oligoribonuclease/PAP phosphatase NrnA [Aquificae bacterium]|nr:bifunctional oligoribonuclease/PAP phosphatase NrnA [Aquificota bacterium]
MVKKELPLAEFLKNAKGSILIVTHENPDGDALGSGLALYKFLKKKGKDVFIASKDGVPHFLDFLPGADEVLTLPRDEFYDVGIVVDSSGFYRAGAPVKVGKKVRIDHHVGGEFYGRYDLVDPSAPATAALVYELIKSWDRDALDPEIATCLYTGLATDTGFFRYSNTDEKTFELARELVSQGADPYYVYTMFSERESLNKMKLISKVLETLSLHEGGQVAGITVLKRFLDETGASYEDTEGLVNYPRSIEGVKVAYALIEKPEEGVWKVSLRAKGDVNVGRIAERLGGGGHKYASGAKIKASSKEEALNKLLSAVREELKPQKTAV